jgi:hypothetical protein
VLYVLDRFLYGFVSLFGRQVGEMVLTVLMVLVLLSVVVTLAGLARIGKRVAVLKAQARGEAVTASCQIRWHARETGGRMPACTQPGCTGRIVDGYCDVCGGPMGAAPFLPAGSAASAASAVPADEPGLTAVRRGPGFPPKPKSNSLMTGCTQPRCLGRIVDGYCDVCGSPAGAVPFVPAAASATSPAPADEPGSTAVPAPTSAPVPVNEEIPTQRIPRCRCLDNIYPHRR